MEAFEDLAGGLVRSRYAEHLQTFFPAQTKALGAFELDKTIEYGIQRSASYGIVSQRGVCKYLNLMFTFGNDFDVDPALPWASRILGKREVVGPDRALDWLYSEALAQRAEDSPQPGTSS